MMTKMTMNKLSLIAVFASLLVCQGNSLAHENTVAQENSQASEAREQARDTQLDEMQKELRLLIKEMVVLNTKLDALTAKPQAVARANNGQKLDLKVNLPPIEKRLGAQEAKYAMIEFMDYQCPYCIRYAKQTLPTLKKRYVDTGQLQYVIRDYPLNFHAKAEGAAVAANCAGEQSKYWEMHDALVQDSQNLGDELYLKTATKLGLDINAFDQCKANPEMKKAVAADFEYGKEVGARGTPNFFIGRIEGEAIVDVIQLSGARPIEAFDKAIQQVMSSGS